jgi:hypothetical protein
VNDIKELLERAVRSVEAAPTAEIVEADLQRGRAALARRRRTIRLGATAVAAAVVLAGAIVASNLGGAPGTIQVTGTPGNGTTHSSGPRPGTPVRLVAYHGDQLDGFVVNQVPDGWYLQGSNAFRLTLAPEGDTTSPDDFEGKLVVMLLSSSAPQKLPEGDPVEVGGHDGVVSHGPPADTLTYDDGAGHLVQVQAWSSALGWTDQQLVAFAEGVQVTAGAQAGVG